jgi:Fe-S cluster assembly scaffold protein SufB
MKTLTIKDKQIKPLIFQSLDLPDILNIIFEENSFLKIVVLCEDSKKCELNIDLKGCNSSVEVYILHTLNLNDESVFSVNINHLCEKTSSKLISKSILDGCAKFEFFGKIYINSVALESCAEMYNKNLLLSDQASVVSLPTLDILCDNVVCRHGAVSSGVEDSQKFYLISRGIALKEVYSILKDSFATEILNHTILNPPPTYKLNYPRPSVDP